MLGADVVYCSFGARSLCQHTGYPCAPHGSGGRCVPCQSVVPNPDGEPRQGSPTSSLIHHRLDAGSALTRVTRDSRLRSSFMPFVNVHKYDTAEAFLSAHPSYAGVEFEVIDRNVSWNGGFVF